MQERGLLLLGHVAAHLRNAEMLKPPPLLCLVLLDSRGLAEGMLLQQQRGIPKLGTLAALAKTLGALAASSPGVSNLIFSLTPWTFVVQTPTAKWRSACLILLPHHS
jgi:hypothetical protein